MGAACCRTNLALALMAQIAGGLFIDRTAIFASPLFDQLSI